MRRFTWLLILILVFQACGTKKRSSTRSGHRGYRTASTAGEKGYPMPDDPGRFVFFDIASAEEYVETFAEVAMLEMKAYGIPASITLAQGMLESGFGRGALTRKTNNHFGIKCHTDWDGEYAYHDDDRKGECFRKYNHPMYSFRDHSIFLSSRSRYAPLFKLRRDDYKGWARGLKAAGYATDRKYPHKLISFIERHRLYRFDRQVLRGGYSASPEPKSYEYTVYKVKKGDTLYSISRKYYVPVKELMEMNDMDSSHLSIGQELRIKTEIPR